MNINIKTAETFLNALSPHAVHTFQIFKDDKTKGKARTLRGTFEALRESLERYQKQGYGVYLTIQETDDSGRRTAGNIKRLRAFFVDIDYCQDPAIFDKSPLAPHIIVSSGRGLHAYWFIEPTDNLESFRAIQKQLIQFFSADGADPAVHDLPRVMRLPGSWHLKNEPLPVRIVGKNTYPRCTLEQIREAFPALKKQKPVVAYELPEISSADDYQWRYEMTQRYVEAVAANTGDGNRHNPAVNAAISIRANGIEPDHAHALMGHFCSLSGLPVTEGYKILEWASKKNFISRLGPLKVVRRRPTRYKFKTIEQVRADVDEKIYLTLQSLKPGLTVIQTTPGTGKTTSTAEVFKDFLRNHSWPTNAAGKPAKGVFLTDNHKLTTEFAREMNIPPAQVYRGRSPDNCVQHDVIDGQVNPGSYCKSMCPVFKANRCDYYSDRERVMRNNLIIAAKQAFLNNSEQIEQFDFVIVDESLHNNLFCSESFDTASLKKLFKALDNANISPEEHKAGTDFVQRLVDELASKREKEKVLRVEPPVMPVPQLERIMQGSNGNLIKPPRFWSLLEHEHTIRIDYENARVHISGRNTPLIERLKQRTVINLDATPIPELLKPFDPEYLRGDVAQNYKLYQGQQYRFNRGFWNRSRYKQTGIDVTRQILEAVTGPSAVFGFKSELEHLQAACDVPGLLFGAYGADSKGTNRFKHVDNLILTAWYTPNISAVKDIARITGADYKKLIQQQQDAEITQTIGRVRAVHRLKPVNVFVLSKNSLKLEKKPRSITQFLNEAKAQILNKDVPVQTANNAGLDGVKITSSTKDSKGQSIASTVKRAAQAVFTGSALKQKLKSAIQRCIDKHGFFAHDLLGRGSGHLDTCFSLQNVGDNQYKRHVAGVLREMGLESHRLVIAPDVAVKIWGDKQRAVEYLTDPVELEQAKQHVQRVYRGEMGAYTLQLQANALGLNVGTSTLIRAGDFMTDLWSILLYRHGSTVEVMT